MKITRVALIIASIMAALTSALHIYSIAMLESRLNKVIAGWKEEGLDKMQAVQEAISSSHHRIYLELAYSSWYLVLAGLLIVIVYRIRNSN